MMVIFMCTLFSYTYIKMAKKKTSKKSKGDDTLTYILIGVILVGCAYYYFYYVNAVDADATQIDVTNVEIPNDTPEAKAPKVGWVGTESVINEIVSDKTPFASSQRGYATKQLNASSNKNIETCKAQCYALDRSTNLVAIAPIIAKARPTCQCYKVTGSFNTSSDNMRISSIAYLDSLNHEQGLVNPSVEASKDQNATPNPTNVGKCPTADKSGIKGYHKYHASDSLINGTAFYMWYDAGARKVRYKRWANNEDTGILEYGQPNQSVGRVYTTFQSGQTVTLDFKRGMVYAGSTPKSYDKQDENQSRVKINNKWYDWIVCNKIALLRNASTGVVTNFDGKRNLFLSSSEQTSVLQGKLTETANELIYLKHSDNKIYCFVNRASMASIEDIPSAVPIYPQVTFTQAHSAQAYYNYGTLKLDEQVESKPVWLLATVPVGKMNGTKFVPDAKRTTHTFFVKNSAIPSQCMSCEKREQMVCSSGTVLVGCGFRSKGYCSSCYRPAYEKDLDDIPCGNCQAGRLMVTDPSTNKIWTDANKLDLRNLIKHESEITEKFTGPYVTKVDKNSPTGRYSIGDCMHNPLCRSRVIKAAEQTGKGGNYCALARGNMIHNPDTVRNLILQNKHDQLRGFRHISTLYGISYGEAICQLGISKSNWLDGGYCSYGYADVDLGNFRFAAGGRSGTNTVGTVFQYTVYSCVTDIRFERGDHLLGRKSGNDMDLKLKWTITPRLIYPLPTLPTYNPFEGIEMFRTNLEFTIYNTTWPEDNTHVDKSKAATFNSGRNEALVFKSVADAKDFHKIKLIKMPPYSAVHISGNGKSRVVNNVHVDFLYVFPSISGFGERIKIDRTSAANAMTDDGFYVSMDSKQQRWNSPVLTQLPNSKCSDNQCAKLEIHNGQIQKADIKINGKNNILQCNRMDEHNCPSNQKGTNIAWAIPRTVAECRVMGLKPHTEWARSARTGCGPNGNPFGLRTGCTVSNGQPDLRTYRGNVVETPAKVSSSATETYGGVFYEPPSGSSCTVM